MTISRLIPANSSNITGFAWEFTGRSNDNGDGEGVDFIVCFGDRAYRYRDVDTATVLGVIGAESQGKDFIEYVKNRYEAVRLTEEEYGALTL